VRASEVTFATSPFSPMRPASLCFVGVCRRKGDTCVVVPRSKRSGGSSVLLCSWSSSGEGDRLLSVGFVVVEYGRFFGDAALGLAVSFCFCCAFQAFRCRSDSCFGCVEFFGGGLYRSAQVLWELGKLWRICWYAIVTLFSGVSPCRLYFWADWVGFRYASRRQLHGLQIFV
jgi:hypothetical protein